MFYFYAAFTMLIPIIGLTAFFRTFRRYRENLTPPALYLSFFLLLFSLNYVMAFLRIAAQNWDISFYLIAHILASATPVFSLAFAISMVWPGREKISIAFSAPLCAIYLIVGFLMEKEVVVVAPGITEIVYLSHGYLMLSQLTVIVMSLFPSAIFLLYAHRVRWGSARRSAIMLSLSFGIIAVFAYVLDFAGLLNHYLPLHRLLIAIGMCVLLCSLSRFERNEIPDIVFR